MKWLLIAFALGLLGTVFPLGQGDIYAAETALPPKFTRVELGAGLKYPTAMAFVADKIFVTEKHGAIRVIRANGKLRKNAFHTLHVSTAQERGLGGIAVDPDYAQNGFIYVYYTTGPGAKKWDNVQKPENRLSRLKRTKSGVVKEKIILDHIPADTNVHNGGDLDFGFDGKLYVTVGDSNCCIQDSQEVDTLRGKVLRINKDRTIPTDNPFYNTPGARKEVYAYGLRNPWRLAPRAANQTYIVADVGSHDWEEINSLVPGGNYGWRTYEGPCPAVQLECTPASVNYHGTIPPIHWYHHSSGEEIGTAVAGGVFAENSNYPDPYANAYFYADVYSGWVHVLELDSSNNVIDWHEFDTGLGVPVSFANGADGNIYVVGYGAGVIYKYVYTP